MSTEANQRLQVLARQVVDPSTIVTKVQAAGMSRPPITSHVLDTTTGRPAMNVNVRLEFLGMGGWTQVCVCLILITTEINLTFD